MVDRSLRGLAPDYFQRLLSSRFEKPETIYCLRNSDNKLKVPPLTNFYKKNISYNGATLEQPSLSSKASRVPREI